MNGISQRRFYRGRPSWLAHIVPFQAGVVSHLLTLLLLAWFQLTVLIPVLGGHYIDTVVPYLVLIFVTRGLGLSFLSLVFASMLLEQNGIEPMGSTLSAYGIILMIIVAVRDHVSWFYGVSWGMSAFLAQLWISIYFPLIYFVHDAGDILLVSEYWISVCVRVLCAVPTVFFYKHCQRKMLLKEGSV
ncbi:MAG: hypothetical protein OXT67_06395 [Zetaproteobacteria bacterium]|nr:hypothetical protein [Zetaproteobacteria bacterium]